ncbi:MAG: hypothetical protein ACTHN8_18050 [Angustibacter sp.]
MTSRRRAGGFAVTSAALAVLAVLTVLTVLTACGSQSGGSPSGSAISGPTSPSAAADPVGLVGLWTVEQASGRPAGERSVLRLAAGDLSWWRDCGVAFGSWRAAEGLLLLDAGQSSVGTCPAGAGPGSTASTWLQRTTRYARDGDGWVLLDAGGRRQATLRPGATLQPRPDVDATLAAPPTLDSAARAAFAEPAPLPRGLQPASPATTAGRWTLATPTTRTPAQPTTGGKPPFVFVAPDGTWTGWDGCNGASGRWLVGQDGRLLTTSGPRTLIGCEGVDLPALWASAARVGLADRELVLVGRDGHELVRLTGPRIVPTVTHGPVQR